MFSLSTLVLVASMLPAAAFQAPAAQGELQGHWAYQAPVRVAVPIASKGQLQSAIDVLIATKWPSAGLRGNQPAARAALARRVYLDVIGLPPTLAELDAFLSDQGDDAYERLVDRLLQSQHYGERWAIPWLDLARYGCV